LIAAYTIPPIVNSKSGQQIPVNLINFANSWLEEKSRENQKNLKNEENNVKVISRKD
jgi:hypothetical protein